MSEQHTASLPKKAKGSRPYFFQDPNVDKLTAMLMALVGEVSVLTDRVDTLERLLQQQGTLPEGAVDGYHPDAKANAERDARREMLIANVLCIIRQDEEDPDVGRPNDPAYHGVIDMVEETD